MNMLLDDLTDDPVQLLPCAGRLGLFYAHDHERPDARARRETAAKAVCAGCPVIEACRDRARLHREHGVWGGETEDERADLGFAPLNATSVRVRERAMAEARHRRPGGGTLSVSQVKALEVLADGPARGGWRTEARDHTVYESTAAVLAEFGYAERVPFIERVRSDVRWRITAAGMAVLGDGSEL